MIPKQAIEAAVVGGWIQSQFSENWQLIVLDPTFWQALGKTLGWEKKMVVRVGEVIGNFVGGNKFVGQEMGFGMHYFNPEIYHAHRFYELILTGGDTEKFWADLLANTPTL